MVNAKGLERWGRLLWLGECVTNSQPHCGKGSKKPIRLMHLNPYLPESKKPRPMSNAMKDAMLDACSVELE